MPEERITLTLKERGHIVWNKEVVLNDISISERKAQIFVGSTSSWLIAGEEKFFTPDFYVRLMSLSIMQVGLYIRYGADASPLGCQPAHGLQYCPDSQTLAVWNRDTCTYDRTKCSTGMCRDFMCIPPLCQPSWECEQFLNGWETDGCGNRRQNPICNPISCSSPFTCEQPPNGYEKNLCGNRRQNPACNPPQIGNIRFVSIPPGAEIFIDGADQGVKTPNTITNVPVGSHTYAMKLAGYNDYTGTVQVQAGQTAQVSATLTPIVPSCTPSWQCEPGQTGWEIDGCGNTRPSSACAVVPPAVRPSRAGLYLAVGTTAFIGAVGFVALTREK